MCKFIFFLLLITADFFQQNILLGATETTALTTLWAMTELLKNPSVMKKVQEEISSLSGQKAF